MPSAPRLLIVTAAFGEGHNSAARNLGLALDAAGAETRVCDPCQIGAPRVTGVLSRGYRWIITYFPKIWAKIYRATDRADFSRKRVPLMRKPELALARLMEEFQPDAVVSTYPIYPYFLDRYFRAGGRAVPVFTVVTDSIEINATWLRCPDARWLVTDSVTRDMMVRSGLPGGRIVDTGFAVHPDFSRLQPVDPADPCDPFRVLYFPTANRRLLLGHGRALLDASPRVRLTVALGRSGRLLLSRACQLKREYPGRVRLVGWTRRVPKMLNTHHLVVGKAGGATVHEAIAARCPMLIHHLVPGQEEGNLKLLEILGAGGLADTPARLTGQLADLLADGAAGWRSMKLRLIRHGRSAGAITAARYILDTLEKPSEPTEP
jgi:processive 1,2-diacylglycerol beta-glucosyltransferase